MSDIERIIYWLEDRVSLPVALFIGFMIYIIIGLGAEIGKVREATPVEASTVFWGVVMFGGVFYLGYWARKVEDKRKNKR